MFYLNKQKIVIMFVICLCLSATKVLACKCSIASASSSVNKAAKVFSGKVVGFEYRKGIASSIIDFREKATGVKIDYETKVVKVQVERWWKGNVPGEVFLVTYSTRDANGTSMRPSCDYNFKEGESYLIYASGKQNKLRTNQL